MSFIGNFLRELEDNKVEKNAPGLFSSWRFSKLISSIFEGLISISITASFVLLYLFRNQLEGFGISPFVLFLLAAFTFVLVFGFLSVIIEIKNQLQDLNNNLLWINKQHIKRIQTNSEPSE